MESQSWYILLQMSVVNKKKYAGKDQIIQITKKVKPFQMVEKTFQKVLR